VAEKEKPATHINIGEASYAKRSEGLAEEEKIAKNL
jgi:hypothetical protein